ncbi:MAG: hypothetical protein HW404_1712, partial [Anaerolineales bacterium]|nr:hypothetical protein [Anaerolineales bacterium]
MAETRTAEQLEKGVHKPEKERVQFKQLLAENPNYFGNLADSPY